MMGLNAAFNKVYEEALAPYGFKKVKGRHPYFTRMVGDEVVHLISCIPRPRICRGDSKKFDIIGGVATVYRGRLNIDKSVINNFNWMKSILEFHRKSDLFPGDKDMFEKWYMFSYDENDEASLIASLKYTAELVKHVVLPIIDRAYNLETCYKYFRNYGGIMSLYENEFEIERTQEDKEGLICTKIFDEEQFEIKEKESFEVWKKKEMLTVEDKSNNYSMQDYEKYEKMFYKIMIEQIERFKLLVSDPVKLENLFQSRKKNNLDILKKHGIEPDAKNLEWLSNKEHPDKIYIPEELL